MTIDCSHSLVLVENIIINLLTPAYWAYYCNSTPQKDSERFNFNHVRIEFYKLISLGCWFIGNIAIKGMKILE